MVRSARLWLNSPQLDEVVCFVLAQEAIDVNYQRLGRIDVHTVTRIIALQLWIRVDQVFLAGALCFGRHDILLLAIGGQDVTKPRRSEEEDVNGQRNGRELDKSAPSERWLVIR